LKQRPDLPGDRLLVDKSVFDWRSPRRWEVVVFRGSAGMAKPYVKRVVGLPGESVLLRDGDVYINGTLARKTLAQARALRVPVFDQRFTPPGGWGVRWLTEPSAPAGEAPSVDGAELYFPAESATSFRWLVYRNWLPDENREEPLRDGFAYNAGRGDAGRALVHDFIVTCEVHLLRGEGELAVVLNDGQDEAGALFTTSPVSGSRDTTHSVRLNRGRTYRLELAFVDRRAMLALDGKEVEAPIDLPLAADRPGVTRPLKIGARGVVAVVRNVRLDRDVYYAGGRHGANEQCRLGPDEYFMLGDNSGNSEDSRYWTAPGVPSRDLLGKPLFLYQSSRERQWGTWGGPALDWDRVGRVR
jgi:signal peptidase I